MVVFFVFGAGGFTRICVFLPNSTRGGRQRSFMVVFFVFRVVGGAGRRRIGRGSASPLLVHVLFDELDVVDIERYDASRSIKTVVETIHIT